MNQAQVRDPLKTKTRVIFHMDGDAFFVGVEIAKNPKLKGLPVVTGEERGIVSAFSYEAKALGITRGMPIFKVKRDFPEVIVLAGDYQSYMKYSSMMFGIVRRYADDVEEYSIDECFADLTGLEPPLKMTYLQIAEKIKKEVNEELGLSVTIGLAPNKVLAKVASKWVKPNGLTVIKKETISDFLRKTEIDKIWGIGPKSVETMRIQGVNTAQDFIEKDISWVEKRFPKQYVTLWKELQGVFCMNVDTELKSTYSSIQKTRTFHPATNDLSFLLSQLSKNIEDACAKARHYVLVPSKVSFFLKDKDFKVVTSVLFLAPPTNAPETIVSMVAKQLPNLHKKGLLYRTTGVALEKLASVGVTQGDLFGNNEKADKFEEIHKHLDFLENKFGKRMVHLASTQEALDFRTKGTDSEDMDRNVLFI